MHLYVPDARNNLNLSNMSGKYFPPSQIPKLFEVK